MKQMQNRRANQEFEKQMFIEGGYIKIKNPHKAMGIIQQLARDDAKKSVEKKMTKTDMYGSDSPMVADISRVRRVALRWIRQDATDKEYPYKITDEDFVHLIRDLIAIAPRLLSIHILPMKPAKKAGTKVKKVNALKKATTAKSKKLLKAKKK